MEQNTKVTKLVIFILNLIKKEDMVLKKVIRKVKAGILEQLKKK